MYTYLFSYCPAESLQVPRGILGTLGWVEEGRLAAMVEPELRLGTIEHDDTRLVQAVFAHDRVIQALFEQITVLPLRFGTCFHDRQALQTHLAQHQDLYLQQLDWFTGKAEYTLKFSVPEEEDKSSTKTLSAASETDNVPVKNLPRGREYFLSKKQHYMQQNDRQIRQKEQLQNLLKTVQRAYPDTVCTQPEAEVERLHLLVSHARFPHLQKQLNQWQNQAPEWQLQLSDPLPPYHFVQPPKVVSL